MQGCYARVWKPGGFHHQTNPDSSWSSLGDCWRETGRANEKGVGELTVCHPNQRKASKIEDPVRGRAEPRKIAIGTRRDARPR